MSLEEWGWLGGLLGGVGIVISVVYLAAELRQNTRAIRLAAFQNVIDSFAGVSFDLARDRQLVDLFVRAAREFAMLDEVERTQYSYMMLSYLRRAEGLLFQTEIRVLQTDQWSGIRASIRAVLTPPGARHCWNEIKDRFNPRFREFIATILDDSSARSIRWTSAVATE
jgi:hypothetical protein